MSLQQITRSVICDNCKNPIKVKPYKIIHYKNHFCSRQCKGEYQTKQALLQAPDCMNCGRKCRKGRKFCSQSCNFGHMWRTVWKDRAKSQSPYRTKQIHSSKIILVVPNQHSNDFRTELNTLIKLWNRKLRLLKYPPIEIRYMQRVTKTPQKMEVYLR